MEYQASYQAILPIKGSLQVVTNQVGTRLLTGSYSRKRRDVLEAYRRDMDQKDGFRPPHMAFADSTSLESLCEWIYQWGMFTALPARSAPNSKEWRDEGNILFGSILPGKFELPLEALTSYQAKFRTAVLAIGANSKAASAIMRDLWSPPFFLMSGGVRFEVEARKDSESKLVLHPMLVPASLAEALALMVWLDLAGGHPTYRTCKNIKCGKLFRADRETRLFCSERCARNHHNLASYHRNKHNRRRRKRSRKRRPT
jgi:hypothetical protein